MYLEELCTQAASRWSAKKMQQNCSPCSQSRSPGSTGMAVQLHWSRKEIWEENHISVKERKCTLNDFIQDSLDLFLTIALEAGVCDESLWRPTIRKRKSNNQCKHPQDYVYDNSQQIVEGDLGTKPKQQCHKYLLSLPAQNKDMCFS